MAKAKKKQVKQKSPFKNYWEKNNYFLLGLGISIIILGFILMAQGPWDSTLSLIVSPIVLLVAYLIILPLSILYKKKKISSADNVSSKS